MSARSVPGAPTRTAAFILGHPRLPDDGVPYWDFDAPGIPGTYRDASAGAIVASALLELSRFVGDPARSYADYYYIDALLRLRATVRDPRPGGAS